ncbi:MAG: flavodoxin/ferredoxin-dependent (E)-4-hydroxy-3-methylbut-2-enyl-diphosphate synthase [Pseudomonadota bacterium]|nr:flavodoxin/ferredoxin-dependent (E)-4-hydroxy-3-methylbut-2-enyl-diphosphate synthase [Pseudomonadota bacterium]
MSNECETTRRHTRQIHVGDIAIGNGGSLERDLLEKYGEPTACALVESALRHVRILEDLDFFDTKISVKASDVRRMSAAYRKLADTCDYPLHLGVTEAGGRRSGTVKSAAGIGALLLDGIGDTIRVSLSDDPCEEVRVGFEILGALDLRHRGVRIISCPTCARKGIDVHKTVADLDVRLAHMTKPLTVAVMGCVVNGPGEAKHADIAAVGQKNSAPHIYIDGRPDHRYDGDDLAGHLAELVEAKS